ncbi:MAG: hypothetical protein ACRECW_10405, partial [Phyllobacterium sp.]
FGSSRNLQNPAAHVSLSSVFNFQRTDAQQDIQSIQTQRPKPKIKTTSLQSQIHSQGHIQQPPAARRPRWSGL